MFLPLGDAPNPRGVPVVTYLLIAANVAVYALVSFPLSLERPSRTDPLVAEYLRAIADSLPPRISLQDVFNQLTEYDLFVFAHGFRPAAPGAGDLVASLFLHGGFMHLFGNMLFLWIYGDNVEHRLGGLRFLVWYLVAGAAATLFHAAFNASSDVPLVGASGAISGVLGFYFLWFPHNTVRVWLFLFPIVMRVIELPARLVLGFYLVVDNLLPFLVAPTGGVGVAHGAHIGGFVAGLGAAWVMNWRSVAARPADYRVPTAEAPAKETPSDVAALIASDRLADAARAYFSLPADRTRRLLEPRASLQLASWLARAGYAKAALTVYQRQLRDFPVGTEAAAAHVGAGLLQMEAFGQMAAAYQHLVEALDQHPDAETAATARRALDAIGAAQKFQIGR